MEPILTEQNTFDREQIIALAEKIIAMQFEMEPESRRKYGMVGREKSVRDAGYHLAYLAAAIEADDAMLFGEYLAWVKVLFAGLGFSEQTLRTTLNCTRQVLTEELPDERHRTALAILDAGIKYLEHAPLTTKSFIDGPDQLDQLARDYLQALLNADRHTASELIMEGMQKGASIKEIYSRVFQPSLRELGRLWQTSQISVAQEHFCTAATQMIMSQLYPTIFSSKRAGRRIVVACVGGELHEVGARMVADFFEMEGWDTYFLGANTPPESIIKSVEEFRADMLAVSVTMTFHINKAGEIIKSLRANPRVGGTPVLVGGHPFNISSGLWKHVGADGYAADATTAVKTAERMLAA